MFIPVSALIPDAVDDDVSSRSENVAGIAERIISTLAKMSKEMEEQRARARANKQKYEAEKRRAEQLESELSAVVRELPRYYGKSKLFLIFTFRAWL